MTTRSLASFDVDRYQQSQRSHPMFAARLVAKYWGHGGYTWFAVTADGELLCARCLRECWNEVVWATIHKVNNGWCVVGYTYTGESDEPLTCANCNQTTE